MRFRFRLRTLMLLVLAVSLFFAGLMAWWAAPQPSGPGRLVMTKTGVMLLKPPRTANDHWRDLACPDANNGEDYVSPRAGFLNVRAVADVNTPLANSFNWPEIGHFWMLRVCRYTPTEEQPNHMETVFYHEYREQAFEATHGTHLRPEFKQLLPLEPGRYFVQVSLPEVMLNQNGELRSTMADGSLFGPLTSFWAVVK